MRKNEIKRTVEELVRIEYIAEDGRKFYDEEECKKYEESALFAVKKELKRLNTKTAYQMNLLDTCDESEIEIFDIQTDKDLENLRRYLYLEMSKNGASEKSIKDCFTSEDGRRSRFVADNITIGHEVIIFWSYDGDWFWVYGDGSLDAYFQFLKDNYDRIIATATEGESNENN